MKSDEKKKQPFVFEIIGSSLPPIHSEDFSTELYTLKNENLEEKFENEIDIFALIPDDMHMHDDDNEIFTGTDDRFDSIFGKEEEKEEGKEKEIDVDKIYQLLEEKRKNMDVGVNITPLCVTTQTAKAYMSQALDLKEIAKTIGQSILDDEDNTFSIRGVLYKDYHYGEIKQPKPRKSGQFPNNCSVLVRSPMGTGRHINIKIFQKGSMTMTGCLIKEDGIASIKILEQYFKKHPHLFPHPEKKKEFTIGKFETTMVNSGYSLGFQVDRERFYDFLKNNTELNVSYAPATYAGVKISFYYNDHNEKNDGICRCPNSICTGDKPQAGKGHGKEIGKCKKVTIAVFESGKVINTGGRIIKHSLSAYEYINRLIKEHAKEFVRIDISSIEEDLHSSFYTLDIKD
jgi:TATA-box binding protein (TBP) (component of TFIID and TFIIIB)